MKTLVVANQKGGVGKTTVARHLAFYGVEQGLRVLAIDLDVQGNFSDTFKNLAAQNGFMPNKNDLVASGLFDRANQNQPVACAERLFYVASDPGILEVERRDLESVIEAGQTRIAEIGKDFDVCVLDTGPAISSLLLVALSVGNFAISPCKPDRDAIAGVAGFFSNVVRIREKNINPNLVSLGVLPNQVNMKRAYHRSVVDEMRSGLGRGRIPFGVI